MNWFKNLKVSKKLLFGFSFASVIAALIGIISYNSLSKMNDGIDEMYKENLLPVANLGYANAAVLIERGDIRAVISVKNLPDREKYSTSCKEQDQIFDDYLEKYEETGLHDKEKELLKTIKDEWTVYKSARDIAVTQALQFEDEKAIGTVNGPITASLTIVRKIYVH